jgi:16S rRNA processing protein RimM
MSGAADKRVVVAALVALHGVRGGFKLRSYCEPPDRLFKYKALELRRGEQSLPVQWRARQSSREGFIVEIEGIADRDQALPWLGGEISVARSQLPKLQAGQYYWVDLEGLAVRGVTDDFDFGVVQQVLDTGANLVLRVRDAAGKERLLPFVEPDYVKSVDLDQGRIVIDWDPAF